MTAVGFTTGDPNKVDVAGDTMTGDLILAGAATDLVVGGTSTFTGASTFVSTATASYAGLTGNLPELVAPGLSTGVAAGGEITPNVDPTKVDISAMVGYIVNYDSAGPITGANPLVTKVVLGAVTGLVLTNLLTQDFTWLLVDTAGVIIQQVAEPTPTQRRTHIVLGGVAHLGGIVRLAQTLPTILSQPAGQLVDLMTALGAFSTSGNILSPNGANLMINILGGPLFSVGLSQASTYQDPHTTFLTTQTPCTFRRITQTTIIPALSTTVDVGNYDVGGVVTPIPGGANTSTVHRVYAQKTANVVDEMGIQYGQTIYSNIGNAVASIGSGSFIVNPQLAHTALIGWIVATKSATDLSSTTQAVFSKAPKFAAP